MRTDVHQDDVGVGLPGHGQGLQPVGGLADHGHVGGPVEDHAEPGSDERLVVAISTRITRDAPQVWAPGRALLAFEVLGASLQDGQVGAAGALASHHQTA
jgi:hypothetical protein